MTSSADARASTGDGADGGPAIVFVGPMGAGKTSIGKRVARALELPFVDTDKAVVAEHGPIDAIFAEHGEPYFRALERAAVRTALAGGGVVVALGGGAVLDPATREALQEHRVVLLVVDPRIVRGRLGGTTRPLVAGDDPVRAWTRIFEERRPIYDEVAQLTIDTSRGPLSQIAEQVIAWIRQDRAGGDQK